ncbi:MAG: sulfatase-like hydrolase/transferase [Bacteroidaceae bacterium]|nr:sulfatase-like hydrolase/transferase [Bacteroidaceae bacterium]
MSVLTLVAYHWRFFAHVCENVGGDVNGVAIIGSIAVILLTFNYFFYYTLVWLGRIVGRCIVGLLFVGNSIAVYFINCYEVLITDDMMGNVLNTRYAEASAFVSWRALLYVLLLGIVPCAYAQGAVVEYGSFRRFMGNVGVSFGVAVVVSVANMGNWPWVDRHVPVLGSLCPPWSYIVNTVRHLNAEGDKNRTEMLLPEGKIATDSRDVCVLIIGESARRANFSLYGYERCTNPLLEKDSVAALIAVSETTYTTGSVKAILDHKRTDELYEILPNYLHRMGVDVVWRTSNWGEPPVHIDRYVSDNDLKALQGGATAGGGVDGVVYDGILLSGLRDEIMSCDKRKMLVVLHTSTSHGPEYWKKYPAEFEVFKPVCKTVEMSKADHQELINAYDNTIVYTDYLLHSVIEILKSVPERRSCMIYVSDHGESLGEGGLYMHGVPMAVAPKEQTEIPFIVWTSEGKGSPIKGEVSQGHVFHSVLSFLGIESPVYDEGKDVLGGCSTQ